MLIFNEAFSRDQFLCKLQSVLSSPLCDWVKLTFHYSAESFSNNVSHGLSWLATGQNYEVLGNADSVFAIEYQPPLWLTLSCLCVPATIFVLFFYTQVKAQNSWEREQGLWCLYRFSKDPFLTLSQWLVLGISFISSSAFLSITSWISSLTFRCSCQWFLSKKGTKQRRNSLLGGSIRFAKIGRLSFNSFSESVS